MSLSWRRPFSALSRFLRPHRHSLAFLNSAQFLGVLNDNIFKLVMVFLLIDTLGKGKASGILSAAGAIYVIPFLLFSSAAGILADRFSKQRLLVAMKGVEITLMILAIFAFAFKSERGSYTLLFLLATHSALFGPSKYGIIPELVPKEGVSRANGLVTSFTYLAIIIGTFLASFLTDITNHNFIFTACFCLFIAVMGFLSTFGIKRTPPQGSEKQLNPFFLSEIYQTLVFCRQRKHLLVSLFGSAYFLFIGAFTQLNIIPFTLQSLHLNEVAGGYLFLATALGIALGSFLAGKASKKRIELGLSCLSALGLAVSLVLIALFSQHLIVVVVFLILLGIFGGIFIVPFDTYIQLSSPDEKRGQVIAAGNFLSFSGVLLASFALFFLSQVLTLSSASGFAFIGIITLGVSLFLFLRLSDLALPYVSRKILLPIYRFKPVHLDLVQKASQPFLVLKSAHWLDAFLLLTAVPNAHLLIPKQRKRSFPYFNNLFYSIHLVDSEQQARAFSQENAIPCLMLKDPFEIQEERASSWKKLFEHKNGDTIAVDIDHSAKTITFRSCTTTKLLSIFGIILANFRFHFWG